MERMIRMLILSLPLIGCVLGPRAHADDKAKAAPKATSATPPAKFSDVDFARLQLAQAQMNDADKAFALAQHAQADAQRTYKDAQQRMNALLAKYAVRAEDVAARAVTIGDDGTITRPAPPPKPSK